LYGANGYTGELVAREAARRGLHPVLAGRNRAQVTALAAELGLPWRIFALEDRRAIEAGLADVVAVLNCAGPFVRTAWPLIEACLRSGVHYVDITGEWAQFEGCAARSGEARATGVMLLPGAGFDVVPSDCLAAHLKARLPSATRLALGISLTGWPSAASRGTAITGAENAHQGAFVREGGRIVNVPLGSRTRKIDFGRGPRPAVIFPWGDVATAWYSTGIPNVEVYFGLPAPMVRAVQLSRYLQPVLRSGAVQNLLIRAIRARPAGPDAAARARGYALLWGEVSDDAGQRAVARLRTPEAYQTTVLSTLAIMSKVVAGQAPAGYQTPSTAYGAGLVLELPGVALSDREEPVVL
jgi:short subunit dehydrogenase-like uncharacterized protein